MKTPKKLFIASAILLSCVSCSKNEPELDSSVENTSLSIMSPSDLNLENGLGATLSPFGPKTKWITEIVDAAVTKNLTNQHNAAAKLFGLGTVNIRFVGGVGSNNAYSYPGKGVGVIYGENFMKRVNAFGGYAVAYLAGHEIAHQAQFSEATVPSNSHASGIELEADAFSAYFMNKSVTKTWSLAAAGYNFAGTIGGGNHGTNAQRRAAFATGWYIATQGTYNIKQLDSQFFYFFKNQVLTGNSSPPTAKKPSSVDAKLEKFMMSKMDELRKIYSGEISEEEFINLNK